MAYAWVSKTTQHLYLKKVSENKKLKAENNKMKDTLEQARKAAAKAIEARRQNENQLAEEILLKRNLMKELNSSDGKNAALLSNLEKQLKMKNDQLMKAKREAKKMQMAMMDEAGDAAERFKTEFINLTRNPISNEIEKLQAQLRRFESSSPRLRRRRRRNKRRRSGRKWQRR